MSHRKRAAWAFAIVVCGMLLLAPALWNGFPLLQYDTGGYLARPFEGHLVPSRPAPYGLLLAAAAPLDFWPALIVQSAATVWIAALVLRTHGFQSRPLILAVLIAILSMLTTLPFLSAILLTDIFAGLGVLGLHLLLFRGEALDRIERLCLTAFVAFCGSTHGATLLMLFAVALSGFALAAFNVATMRGAWRSAAAILLGFAITFTANFAVSRKEIWPPGGYGIVFGRMLQDGAVAKYLNAHCPDASLRLCPYRNELPATADDFLWSEGVFNKLGRFTGLNSEMRAIVLGSLREEPLLHLKLAALASLKQLAFVRSGEGVVDSVSHTYGIIERFTPNVLPAMRAARQQNGGIHFGTLNKLHVPVAWVSLALLGLLASYAALAGKYRALECLALTAAIAVLANAALCGVLSNPHDRYGARIAWIGTFVGALWVARALSRDRDRSQAATKSGPPG